VSLDSPIKSDAVLLRRALNMRYAALLNGTSCPHAWPVYRSECVSKVTPPMCRGVSMKSRTWRRTT